MLLGQTIAQPRQSHRIHPPADGETWSREGKSVVGLNRGGRRIARCGGSPMRCRPVRLYRGHTAAMAFSNSAVVIGPDFELANALFTHIPCCRLKLLSWSCRGFLGGRAFASAVRKATWAAVAACSDWPVPSRLYNRLQRISGIFSFAAISLSIRLHPSTNTRKAPDTPKLRTARPDSTHNRRASKMASVELLLPLASFN